MNANLEKDELEGLVDKILVKHDKFKEVIKSIDMCYQGACCGSESTYLAIIGPPRAGKSRVLEHFESRHERSRTRNGLTVPVLRLKVPSKPTVIGLIEKMLCSLGDPLFFKGTENIKTERLHKLCIRADVKVLILDEFQHFYDQGSKKIQHSVADWLKIFIDDRKIGLVVAGLPISMEVIASNEQLESRFFKPIQISRFDWLIQSEREQFLAVLYSMQIKLDPFSFPELYSPEMGYRMYCASNGLMGFIVKILRKVTANALDKNNLNITLEDLNRAHSETMWNVDGMLDNPFSRSIQLGIDCADVEKKQQGTENNELSKIFIPEHASEILRT